MPTYLNLNLSSDYSKCSDGPDAFPANSFDHKGSVAFGPNKVGGCQFWRCLLLKPLKETKLYLHLAVPNFNPDENDDAGQNVFVAACHFLAKPFLISSSPSPIYKNHRPGDDGTLRRV